MTRGVGVLQEMWSHEGNRNWKTRALRPGLRTASGLFRLGLSLREWVLGSFLHPIRHAPLPVVSIGGLEVGGVGKTPLTLELVRRAAEVGLRPAVLSRGYGATDSPRSDAAPRRVPIPAPRNAAALYGDEPLWLAEEAAQIADFYGVWVGRNRLRAARAAAAAGAGILLLDDGFQHRQLHRQADVVTLAARRPFANGRLLPAGPLREPPAALGRADRVVLAGAEHAEAEASRSVVASYLRPGTEVFCWRSVPALRPVRGVLPAAGEAVILLAAIAHPERLEAALSKLGHPVRQGRFFRDHHPFTPEDLRNLPETAEGPPVVTTAKDWMRLRELPIAWSRLSLIVQSLEWEFPAVEENWRRWLAALVQIAKGGA